MTELNGVDIQGLLDSPSIPHSLDRLSNRTDDGFTFLRSSGKEVLYTFSDLSAQMHRRGRALLERGLRKGDRVGFIIPEGEEFVLTFLGALAAGIVPVPMYPPFSFGKLDNYVDQAARILDTANAAALLTDKRTQALVWSLIDRVNSLEQIITLETLAVSPSAEPIDLMHLHNDDSAFLQFTSGSTAEPKGVVVTHGNLRANCRYIILEGLDTQPSDRACTWLPLYHDMGLIGFVLSPVWYGLPTYFIPTLTFVKHPSIWLESMSKFGGTMTFGPNFAYALAARRTSQEKLEELDLRHVKVMGCGAEPNHPGTLNAFLDHFEPAGLRRNVLLPAYGLAESTLAVTFVGIDDPLYVDEIGSQSYHADGCATAPQDNEATVQFVSCGRAFSDHLVRIVDEGGADLGERRVGEVVIEGPSITSGYFGNEEATAKTFREGGLRTGDLGYLSDGDLYITGRQKDVIILNGRNYDPQTIEWAAAEVPGVRKGSVVAFSRPSAATEELVVVAESNSALSEDLTRKVAQRIRDTLSLNPSDVMLLEPGQLPKTSSGKLQRAKTRSQYLAGTLGREGVRTLGAHAHLTVLARHLARSLLSRCRHTLRCRLMPIWSASAKWREARGPNNDPS